MQKIPLLIVALALLLGVSILIAGCVTDDTVTPAVSVTTSPNAARLYANGDVVRNPASAATTAWLILGYDAASDSYERALIYPDANGNWGYRKDSRTEKAGRLVMEKVYTEIVTNTLPSSVRIVTPTIVTVAVTTPWGSSATTAPTAMVPLAPVITGITPDEGNAGALLSIRNLAGENFAAGASVTLSRNNSATITATDVRTVTNKSITCTIAIPADAAVGAWDVTVRNPDGRYDTFTNIFTVHRDTAAVTTANPAKTGAVNITSIDPPFSPSSGRQEFTITGSRFKNGATVTLKKTDSPDIEAVVVVVNSDTNMRCFFQIPTGTNGFWDIVINNMDGTYGKWTGGLEIRS